MFSRFVIPSEAADLLFSLPRPGAPHVIAAPLRSFTSLTPFTSSTSLLLLLLLRHNSAVPKFPRLFLLLAFLPILSRAQSSPPYLDPSLPIDQRVNDLVSRLTLE